MSVDIMWWHSNARMLTGAVCAVNS